MDVIDKIFKLLKERHLTQKDFANSIGVSNGNVADWKSGRSKPTISVIPKIADYFGVSIDYLYDETEGLSNKYELTDKYKIYKPLNRKTLMLSTHFHDFNEVKIISDEYGPFGTMFYLDLIVTIYKNNAYYFDWNKNKNEIISDPDGPVLDKNEVEEVENVVNRMAALALFDENLLKSYGILTAKYIQLNYIKANKDRKKISIKKDYFLLEKEDLKKLSQSVIKKLEIYETID